MIEAVEAYIENIVGLMIVTALVEMIMPESGFKKYARLITGLIIVAAVVEPAVEVIYGKGFDFELKEVYLSQNGNEQRKIVNDIYIKEIEKNCVNYAEKNGIEIRDIKTDGGGERINEVDIYIKPPHSCIKNVQGFDEEEEVCDECEDAAYILAEGIKEITGIGKIDVIVLEE